MGNLFREIPIVSVTFADNSSSSSNSTVKLSSSPNLPSPIRSTEKMSRTSSRGSQRMLEESPRFGRLSRNSERNVVDMVSDKESHSSSITVASSNLRDVNDELAKLSLENEEFDKKLEISQVNNEEKLDQSQLKLDNSSETDLSDYRSRLSTMEANDLRNKLASERQTYQRRLSAFQEGQTRQASLVQKLQAKVLQYKRKCTDLEQSGADANLSYEKSRNRLQEDLAKLQQKLDQSNDKIRNVNAQHDVDINDIVDRLEREQKKNVGLQEVNTMLREETDALQNDNIKLKE